MLLTMDRLRTAATATAVALTIGLVAACGSGPSQAGSAAIIGEQAVPLGAVQARLDVALARTDVVDQLTAQGVRTEDISRDVVTRSVLHTLLAEAAQREGIVVTDEQVTEELATAGGEELLLQRTVFTPESLREAARDQLTAIALAEKYVDRLVVTVDITSAQNQADAEAKARTVAAGGAAADALFDDPRTAQQGLVLRASDDPVSAGEVYFGTPAGRVIAFQPSPGQAVWVVLRVTSRTIEPAPAAGTAGQVDRDTLVGIGERLVQPLADELGVEVNPRFGVWDPIRLRVVPSGPQAGLILPIRTS